MPWRFWQNACCDPGVWRGSPERCSCMSGRDQRSRWMLKTDERKLRYQLHFGLTPMGPHRKLSDHLLKAVTRPCSHCDGEGLLESHGLGTWKVCPSCGGFGSLPLPNSPELLAIRAQVAKQYAAAVVPGADDVGPTSLQTVLENSPLIVQDLQTGAMLCDSL
jgi:hypothetical protein